MNHVRINTPFGTVNSTTVEIDGHRIAGLRAFQLNAQVGHITTLALDVTVRSEEINGEMCVTTTDELAAQLTAIGWTPPADTTAQGKSAIAATQERQRITDEPEKSPLDVAEARIEHLIHVATVDDPWDSGWVAGHVSALGELRAARDGKSKSAPEEKS